MVAFASLTQGFGRGTLVWLPCGRDRLPLLMRKLPNFLPLLILLGHTEVCSTVRTARVGEFKPRPTLSIADKFSVMRS
jgi:hypothetical protein